MSIYASIEIETMTMRDLRRFVRLTSDAPDAHTPFVEEDKDNMIPALLIAMLNNPYRKEAL